MPVLLEVSYGIADTISGNATTQATKKGLFLSLIPKIVTSAPAGHGGTLGG